MLLFNFNHLYVSVPLALAVIILSFWYIRHVRARAQSLESVYLSHLAQLFAQSKRKYAIIPAMAEKVREYAPGESDLLNEIEREATRAGAAVENLKRTFRNPGAFSEIRNRENTLAHRLDLLNSRLDRYPALRNTASFSEISGELKNLEEKLAFNLRHSNEAAAEFNSYCHDCLPRRMVVRLLGYREKAPLIEGIMIKAADAAAVKTPENTTVSEMTDRD